MKRYTVDNELAADVAAGLHHYFYLGTDQQAAS
jgi:hypothetical protein